MLTCRRRAWVQSGVLLAVAAGCIARNARPIAPSGGQDLLGQVATLRLAANWDEAGRLVSAALARPGLARDDRVRLLVERSNIEREVGSYRRQSAMAVAMSTLIEAEALVDESIAPSTRAAAAEARGWLVYGSAFGGQARFDDAMPWFQRAHRLRERIGDRAGLANSWFQMGLVHQQQGRLAEAKAAFERGHAIAAEEGLLVELGYLERHLGSIAEHDGDLAQALRRYERSLDLRERAGHRWGVAFAAIALGNFLGRRGDVARAARLLERAAAIAADLRVHRGAATAAESLADLDHGAGRNEQACRRLADAARTWQVDFGDVEAAVGPAGRDDRAGGPEDVAPDDQGGRYGSTPETA